MLTSIRSAPASSTIRAASAITAGSAPKIWIATGRGSSPISISSRVRRLPWTSPWADTISETASPAP
jgi:hypothetical protein